MRIAILGTRGIPASYSRFETAAEQLASRLAGRGHEVIVYCRPHVVDRRLRHYKGASLVHLGTIQNKYLDTLVHTFRSAAHATRVTRPDVALFFIAGNSPLCLITRRGGIPSVINIDGLDSDRRKWPALAKTYLRFAESRAPRWADRAITDSHEVADVFERRYGARIGVVPYGVDWELVTDQYEQLLSEVCAANRHGSLPRSLLDLEHVVPEPASELATARG